MRKTLYGSLVAVAIAGTAIGSLAIASGGGDRRVEAGPLSGYNEIPLTLSTPGTGGFRATIDDEAQEIRYRLTYAATEGTVTQAHIHFGTKFVAAGIAVFLCSNLGNAPAGTQACPVAPATITGVIRPQDVIGPEGQGIAPGEFTEIVAAMRARATYVNVHTTKYPAGEIRAQIGDKHHRH